MKASRNRMVQAETIRRVSDELVEVGAATAMERLGEVEPHLCEAVRCRLAEATSPLAKMGILQDLDWSLIDELTLVAVTMVEATRREYRKQ